MEDGSCPHEAGLSIAKPFPLNYFSYAQGGCLPHSGWGRVQGEAFFLIYFFHRHSGGLRLARSSLPSDDTWGLVVALRIAISACFRGVRHASQRAPRARNSRHEVPIDVTRAPNLRGFACRPA